MEATDSRKLDWVVVTVLTVLGLGLRIAYLREVPPFLDEYSSMLTGLGILDRGGLPELPSGVLYTAGMLFSYLEALFFGLFGFSDTVARLPSLLISTATLPILYVITRNLLNRRVALLSVALLAVMPEAVVWGGRARMYSALLLLVLLTCYYFYRGVLPRDRETDSTPDWLWVIFFLAAIFTQDEALMFLPFFWLAALAVRGWRWFLKPATITVQVLLPLAGAGARIWLYDIRVPGEVYKQVHDAYFRFPPAIANGLRSILPFFVSPWAWLASLMFVVGLVFLVRDLYLLLKRREITPESRAAAFAAYVVLAIATTVVVGVNAPWQDHRYLFMVLPFFLMVASWGLDRMAGLAARRWSWIRRGWATAGLVALVTLLILPAGISALERFEPDYSAAFRWLGPQLGAEDLVASNRPAPAAVYLGRSDFLVAEDKHLEFIMRLEGVWVDRWSGARVLESPDAFRQEALESDQPVWFVVDEDRFGSVAYSPELIALVLQQMDLVYREGGVLIFRGHGFAPPPEMEVERALDVNFGDQLLLKGLALSTDHPAPGQEVLLRLFWQAVAPERNYTVSVRLDGADGQGLAQNDGQPLLGLYDMTTHWPRDEVVMDERGLSIPETTAPGRYLLQVRLYDPDAQDAGPVPVLDRGGNIASESVALDYLNVNLAPAPLPAQPVSGGNLGGLVQLAGYDPPLPGHVATGSTLPLTLTWEVLGRLDADYTIFVHVVGEDGSPQAQVDSQPLSGTYPTSFWDAGETIVDPYLLDIPPEMPAGEYDVMAGMYLLATGDRLPHVDASGRAVGDSISLGRISVSQP